MVYWNLFKNSFHSNYAYKIDTLTRGIKTLLALIMRISVWLAIYSVGINDMVNNNTKLNEMICYVIVSTGISVLVGKSNILMIDEKIRTGDIAMDIIKPISFRKYIFSVAMGRNVYNFTFQFLPMLIVVAMLVQMYVEIQGIFHIMIFLVFLIGAILIRFLSGYMLGLLWFWYLTIWHLDRALNDMISLFAGSFIPLWLFPKGLQAVAEWLPFKFIYYVPISAILGKIESGNYSILVTQMIGWIVILYLVGSLIWKFGHKHLMVQGG